MIDNEYLRMMARYNRWQNQDIFHVTNQLSDQQRRENHNAFWGSIIGTLSHTYWADQIWLSRFDLVEAPNMPIKESADFVSDWEALKSKRITLDNMLIQWCDNYPKGPIRGNLEFFSGAMQKQIKTPLPVVFTHFFNHQTHNRGQVNALLSLAGKKTGDTDLLFMPEELWPS